MGTIQYENLCLLTESLNVYNKNKYRRNEVIPYIIKYLNDINSNFSDKSELSLDDISTINYFLNTK